MLPLDVVKMVVDEIDVNVLPPFCREEFEMVSHALCRRLAEGTMPPDDAYWWTRTLCAEPQLVYERKRRVTAERTERLSG